MGKFKKRKKQRLKIKEMFPYFMETGGFMANFQYWLETNHSTSELYLIFPSYEDCLAFDIYYTGKYGEKWASRGLANLYNTDYLTVVEDNNRTVVNIYDIDIVLDDNYFMGNIDTLCQLLYTIWGNKWNKMLNAYYKEYDILAPYTIENSKKTIEDIDKTNTNAKTGEYDLTRSDQSEQSTEVSQTGTTVNDQSTYAYNSDTATPTDSSETGTTQTGNQSATATNTRTDKNTETESESGTATEDNTITEESVLKGNLGNMSYQDLLRKELDLWETPFWDRIANDLNSFFTTAIY